MVTNLEKGHLLHNELFQYLFLCYINCTKVTFLSWKVTTLIMFASGGLLEPFSIEYHKTKTQKLSLKPRPNSRNF